MLNYLIRDASGKDLPEILRIENSWDSTPHWNQKQFERELELPFSHLWIAELDSRAAGYLCFWKLDQEIQIADIAVEPQWKGHGLAEGLVRKLIREAKECSIPLITLEVREDNLPAIRLYEKSGFQIVGRRPKFYNRGPAPNPVCDALLMELKL